MWLFSSPTNYNEMVEKISKSLFVIVAVLLYALTCINDDFNQTLRALSFGAEYEIFGLKLNLALLYFPLLMGIFEHMFKLHDLLSDLFKIRKRYDKTIIVSTIIKKAQYDYQISELDDKKVNLIMSKCFYEYASSTNPKIDTHSISLALNEWCWFWILLDTLLAVVITGIVFLFLNWAWVNLLFLIICILILLMFMFFVMIFIKKYTDQEITAIFSDDNRVNQIRENIGHALSDE